MESKGILRIIIILGAYIIVPFVIFSFLNNLIYVYPQTE